MPFAPALGPLHRSLRRSRLRWTPSHLEQQSGGSPMRDFIWAALTTAALVLALPVAAQQPPAAAAPAAPPAAGGTADGSPFDIPYGTPVTLETAKKLIAA